MGIEHYILLGLILIAGAVYIFRPKNRPSKPAYLKKEQIVQDYKKRLQSILDEASTKEERLALKTTFLKECSSELQRNIYFTQEEIKQVISDLASM